MDVPSFPNGYPHFVIENHNTDFLALSAVIDYNAINDCTTGEKYGISDYKKH